MLDEPFSSSFLSASALIIPLFFISVRMYARRGHSMQLDEHRLLLNGLQPIRRLRDRAFLASERPSKRQRAENLNSRYDRMIQTVNAMHPSPAHAYRNKGRPREASSSSATTNDAPRTPESAYSLRHSSNLGGEFSILNKSGRRPSVKGSDPFDPAAFTGISDDGDHSTKFIPSWLKDTISTLEAQNPLRLLLLDDIAALEDSSQYSQHASNLTIDHDQENLPFAHTSPTTLSAGFRSTSFAMNEERAVSPSNVRGHREDTIALELLFSTPGPASTTSRLACPVLARSPAYAPPWLPTVSLRPIDTSASSDFVPFAKPGPCSLTERTAHPRVATSLHLHQQHATSPSHDIASLALNSLASPQHVLPFSTPGPLPPPVKVTVSTYTSLHFVESPAHDDVAFRIWPSLHNHPQQGSTPDLLYSSPASAKRPIRRSLASSRSSSVEGSPFGSWEEHGAPAAVWPHSPLVPDEQLASVCGNIDHNSLDFKWERFDRGDMVADPASFSSPRAPPGSEETFWSQPARHFPALCTLAQRRDHSRRDSSPASLRLSGVSTPLPTSPRSPCNHPDLTKDAVGRPQDGNPFAWMIPPRHAGPPSTPQLKKSSSRRTPRTHAPSRNITQPRFPDPKPEAGPANAGGGFHWQGQTSSTVVNLDTSERQGRPAERRVPFAPCSGIYISPLQNNSPDIKDKAGDMKGAREDKSESKQRPRQMNGKQAGSTGDMLPMSEGCVKDVNQRPMEVAPRASAWYVPPITSPHQDHGVYTPGTNAGKRSVSQSTMSAPTQSRGNPYDGEEDEIEEEEEEEEEDQLEDCSQETRDTIESWTA